MFTKINVKDFKSITMLTPIDLHGLSILCGSNSSGKSSLIQVLLMLSQSFSGRYQDEPITLNGHLTQLGSFRDIKSYATKNDGISISFTLEMKDDYFGNAKSTMVNYDITFGAISRGKQGRDDEYHPSILKNKIVVYNLSEDGEKIETDRIVIELDSSSEEIMYTVTEFESPENNRIKVEYPDFKILGSKRCELVPTAFILEYNYIKKISSHVINFATNFMDSSRFQGTDIYHLDEQYLVLTNKFMRTILSIIVKERQEIYDSIVLPDSLISSQFYKDDESSHKSVELLNLKENIVNSTYNLRTQDIPPSFLHAETISLLDWHGFLGKLEDKTKKTLLELIDKNRALLQELWCESMQQETRQTFFNVRSLFDVENLLNVYFSRSVKYLGPLRMEPQAIYSSRGQYDPNSVGLKGEFTAAVLHKNKDRVISYLSPIITNGDLEFHTKAKPLRFACQEWLSYLGVIEEFSTKDRGKLGYELLVKTNKNDKWQDLTHVGVGVSQVLPIVLMFLISEQDDVLIFEQPELHLHPQVQSRLCDLFIAMVQSKRQCIIETHSEYLINRLRLRIAQERDGSLNKNTAMFFITKNNGYSEFSQIEINRFGSVIDWPTDFFDQTDREIEKILYEAGRKRKLEIGDKGRFSFEVKK
ncbi:DUF3696 domain-containing protein [Cedecea davisae]|uniref:AAA family ATPase n=1 Tax=Cedecea davisae TaxID=158484 RepID=UPI00376F43CC